MKSLYPRKSEPHDRGKDWSEEEGSTVVEGAGLLQNYIVCLKDCPEEEASHYRNQLLLIVVKMKPADAPEILKKLLLKRGKYYTVDLSKLRTTDISFNRALIFTKDSSWSTISHEGLQSLKK